MTRSSNAERDSGMTVGSTQSIVKHAGDGLCAVAQRRHSGRRYLAPTWRLFGDAEIGEALRDCREHAVELAGLRHFVIHVWLSGAAPEQRGVAVDHPDRVELDI